MTFQEQVCTPEQGRRLRELGCEQPSLMMWVDGRIVWNPLPMLSLAKNEAPAYTVAELGEMLVNIDFDLISLIHYSGNKWLMYVNHSTTKPIPFPTEAQAKAALLIHILEQEQS